MGSILLMIGWLGMTLNIYSVPKTRTKEQALIKISECIYFTFLDFIYDFNQLGFWGFGVLGFWGLFIGNLC